MSVKVAVTRVTLNGTTGNQDISAGGGFGTPKAAIFFVSWAQTDGTAATNAKISIGFTDGTLARCTDYTSNHAGGTDICSRGFNTSLYHIRSGGGTLQHEAAFVTWITDGIRINITTAVTGILATVIFIGGDEPQCHVNTLTNNAAIAGTTAVTAPGFTPHTIFFTSANTTSSHVSDACIAFGMADKVSSTITQRSVAMAGLNGADTTSIAAYVSTAHACKVISDTAALVGIDITSFDATGFTSTTRDVAASTSWAYLAVNWGTRQHQIASVFSPTTVSSQASTWPGFRPQALIGGLMLAGSQNTLITNQNAGGLALAAITPTAEFCASINAQDAVGTTVTQSLSDNQAVVLEDEAGATLLVATLTSMDATGYTLNYTAAGVAGRAGIWFAVEAEAGGAVPKVQHYRRMRTA